MNRKVFLSILAMDSYQRGGETVISYRGTDFGGISGTQY